MKTALVVGTRPEIIKMSPVMQALAKRQADFAVLFTRQHFTPVMGERMLEEFEYGTDRILEARTDGALMDVASDFDAIVVLGDTTSVALGAVAAVSKKKLLVHVEAGLRSYDMRMREERNRAMVDHASDLMYAPCLSHALNLLRENVLGKVKVVGNTIADVLAGLPKSQPKGGFCLITLHRPELVEEPAKFQSSLDAVSRFLKTIGRHGFYPMHPFSRQVAEKNHVVVPPNISVASPLTAHQTWKLIQSSDYVFTDSGGIQEEACILGTPCFTIRPNTERPETVDLRANVIVPPSVNSVEMVTTMIEAKFKKEWEHPDGKNVGETIVQDLLREGEIYVTDEAERKIWAGTAD